MCISKNIRPGEISFFPQACKSCNMMQRSFFCYLNIFFGNLLIFLVYILNTSKPGICFKRWQFVSPIEATSQHTWLFISSNKTFCAWTSRDKCCYCDTFDKNHHKLSIKSFQKFKNVASKALLCLSPDLIIHILYNPWNSFS